MCSLFSGRRASCFTSIRLAIAFQDYRPAQNPQTKRPPRPLCSFLNLLKLYCLDTKYSRESKNKNYLKKYFFLHISSSYAKILGETNFRTREIPRSGSKAEDGEEKRLNDGNNNGQAKHGARKPPGPILYQVAIIARCSINKIDVNNCISKL